MNKAKYIILGGGMVAGYAAKQLVEQGLEPGELMILSADSTAPYERPPLSKGFLSGKDSVSEILINSSDWYSEHGIDLKLNTVVDKVDVNARLLRMSSGEEIGFETLLIATGAQPRKLDGPGQGLGGIFYLRMLGDAERIRAAASGAKRAVVIGGGFIGMEVAAVLAQKNIETTLVIREDRVWSRVFSPELSDFFEQYYSARGVHIAKHASVTGLNGKKSVGAVKLGDGKKIACDLVVAGIGVVAAIRVVQASGFDLDNGILVNEFLETNQKQIYAAGDVANYPDLIFEKRRRVEHWDNAVSQAQHWARTITGDRQPFVHVPYFFSDIFDLSYELWGDSAGSTQTVIRGDLSTSSFSVWWLNGSRVISAFVMNRPDEERQLAPEWIRNKNEISPDRLGDLKAPLRDAA
jgi:3-phenylpropionate/trans-cinnamate dioxygenase ferredoxin reductase subunit